MTSTTSISSSTNLRWKMLVMGGFVPGACERRHPTQLVAMTARHRIRWEIAGDASHVISLRLARSAALIATWLTASAKSISTKVNRRASSGAAGPGVETLVAIQ